MKGSVLAFLDQEEGRLIVAVSQSLEQRIWDKSVTLLPPVASREFNEYIGCVLTKKIKEILTIKSKIAMNVCFKYVCNH